jgi:hypothetical protein
MTVAEPDSNRARLSVEPLEGREAPGGWGCWGGGWDGWSNWWNRSDSGSDNGQCQSSRDNGGNDGGWRHRGGSDCGNDRSDCGRSWWGGCRADNPPPPTDCPKPPPPCQPPAPPPAASPSTISGLTYQDDNRNGLFDAGEPLLPDVTVTLSGTNQAGQAVNVTVTTDANGVYTFNNLDAGTYSIQATPPTGLLTGHSVAGSFGGTPADNAINNVGVPAGQTSGGYDIGFETPRPR